MVGIGSLINRPPAFIVGPSFNLEKKYADVYSPLIYLKSPVKNTINESHGEKEELYEESKDIETDFKEVEKIETSASPASTQNEEALTSYQMLVF